MTTDSHLPSSVATPADVEALETAARRVETPCGDSTMVWHVWGEGRPVVLLHGGAGSWTHWVRNIAPLARAGCRVCVPDLPGSGDSAPPPNGEDADALPPGLEQGLGLLIPGEACDVVGFSFGAMVGAFIASRDAVPVRQLVLVGAPALSREPSPRLDLRGWKALPPGPERQAVQRHNLRSLMLADDEAVDALSIALQSANVERDRMTRRRLSQTDVLVRTLPRVGCPVSGIWGSEDALYRGRTPIIGAALAHAPAFRTLTLIPGAGHWVQYERAAAFNEALLAALAAVPVQAGQA
jgi:pimeloyl-ACP methyl ester carboxylesterase